MFWSFAFIFFFCEFGERVSNGFSELNDRFNQLDWYLFSIGIQRLLPTIMVVTQQRVVLRTFGNITCTRDMFKEVSPINVFITWIKLSVFPFVQGNQSRILMLHDASSIRIIELPIFSIIILFSVSFLETGKTHVHSIKRFINDVYCVCAKLDKFSLISECIHSSYNSSIKNVHYIQIKFKCFRYETPICS